MKFEVTYRDHHSHARAGSIESLHGKLTTPVFMPVGTVATVKAILPRELLDLGYKIILANTYHLFLRPGMDVIRLHGGLHRFMGWEGSILTDSGGFQIFSLAPLRKITEEGVTFRSHIDGSMHQLTPETAIDIQKTLGSDVMMAFDECPPSPIDRKQLEASVARTSRWAKRCLLAKGDSKQALFGITQGGIHLDLRKSHIETMAAFDFDGFAIGGLSVGEPVEKMYEVTEYVAPLLPDDKPRYMMGVGTPRDLIRCIGYGVDMFDCVLPTRNARNGMLFTFQGPMTVKQSQWQHELNPPDPACACYTCRHFSMSYLRHLYINKEILSSILLTHHNLHFYQRLIERAREAITRNSYRQFVQEMEPLLR